MKDKNKNSMRRVRNLVILFALTAVVVSVATYAWFIGLQTVNVTSFDVTIAGTDSLQLSLDGITFGESVTINGSNYDVATYEDNTNWWAGTGLLPMSTVGQINQTSSRLYLYEKASLTPSPGGMRLLASEVENHGDSEYKGYVAFDLFVKNYTGTNYIPALNQEDEEAIYLTTDSRVVVSDVGGTGGTGIENSVRVAFAEIGRVIGTTPGSAAELIQGIDCAGTDEGVTGICRAATIWEPNDTSHTQGAIGWYNTTCRQRVSGGTDITLAASYNSSACGVVVDGLAYPTYAIKAAIPSKSNVDIYDGLVYNTYAGSASFLDPVKTFTDTQKFLAGTSRPTLLTLAPNSITKLRVYIYIEGQDIDNYDFASVGKMINVAFGFTKQRFTEDDFDYTGPDANQGEGPAGADLTPPRIQLTGDEIVTVTLNESNANDYTDAGATATDNVSETANITLTSVGTVNTSVAGTYKITWKAVDEAGNLGVKTRTVIVE